jgi:hypothetical protein
MPSRVARCPLEAMQAVLPKLFEKRMRDLLSKLEVTSRDHAGPTSHWHAREPAPASARRAAARRVDSGDRRGDEVHSQQPRAKIAERLPGGPVRAFRSGSEM